MTALLQRRCTRCEGGIAPLDSAVAAQLAAQIPHWRRNADGTEIDRLFRFPDFHHTMAFVNAVAWVAHQEHHHPDLEVSYNQCRVRYSTHAIGGLSENDFICAAKIDALSAD